MGRGIEIRGFHIYIKAGRLCIAQDGFCDLGPNCEDGTANPETHIIQLNPSQIVLFKQCLEQITTDLEEKEQHKTVRSDTALSRAN